MSRIGKKPIALPAGVTVSVNGALVTAKGPKGELTRQFPPQVKIQVMSDQATVEPPAGNDKVVWGLSRARLNNMIQGVSSGFTETLEFSGVGYKAVSKGDGLELNLGYTHPVNIAAPPGVSFQVEKNTIRVTGIDKEAVGQTAARLRAARPPEPYKGSGVKYADEVIQRKAGKKAVTGT